MAVSGSLVTRLAQVSGLFSLSPLCLSGAGMPFTGLEETLRITGPSLGRAGAEGARGSNAQPWCPGSGLCLSGSPDLTQCDHHGAHLVLCCHAQWPGPGSVLVLVASSQRTLGPRDEGTCFSWEEANFEKSEVCCGPRAGLWKGRSGDVTGRGCALMEQPF